MSSTNADPTIVLDSGSSEDVFAVAFHPDGRHLLGGGRDGIRRWRLEDGQEVGRQASMSLRAVAISKDGQRVVCGTKEGGAIVWDGELRERVIYAEGGNWGVWAVDVSPDSTRFATATEVTMGENKGTATIWSMSTGQVLLRPIAHNRRILGIRFSPSGEHIATAAAGDSIRIFDSLTGDNVANIKCEVPTPDWNAITPLAWSNDGRWIFATERGRVKCFDGFESTRSRLFAISLALTSADDDDIESIALAANGKFVATYSGSTISLLESSTLAPIGPAVRDSEILKSIALSSDSTYLATGRADGKVTVRNLAGILHAHAHKEQQSENPSLTSEADNELPMEESREPSPRRSGTREGGDDDELLELEVPSNRPAPEFDYSEPPSPISAGPPGSSDVDPQLATPLDAPCEENADTAKSFRRLSTLRKWLPTRIGKSNMDLESHESDGGAGQQSRPLSPVEVGDTKGEPSWMAPGQYDSRASTGYRPKRQRKSRLRQDQGASHGSQRAPDSTTAGQAQASNPYESSERRIHVVERPGSGDAVVAVRLPAWLLCRASGTGDGTHG